MILNIFFKIDLLSCSIKCRSGTEFGPKKIAKWYKKCGERTRNFLWRKKNQELGVPLLKLPWTGTTAEWGIKVLHSNAVPFWEFQWHCQFVHRKAPFKLAILLCWYLFVDHWTCVLCWGNLVSRVWCLRQTSQSDGRIEREANSSPVLPWKVMLPSPVAGKDHEAIGDGGDYGNRKELSFREKLLRWSELLQTSRNCTGKNVYSQWWTFLNFPINNK